MELEGETLVEVAVSLAGVGLFIAAVVAVGLRFDDGGLSGEGGLLLVGSIALFVLVMTVAGYWLSARE